MHAIRHSIQYLKNASIVQMFIVFSFPVHVNKKYPQVNLPIIPMEVGQVVTWGSLKMRLVAKLLFFRQ
jgi:hypothetical protein